MESTERQDAWERLVSPKDVLEEMGLLAGDDESQGDIRKSEPYWSVKTHYPSIDELFKGFKSGNLVGIGGKHAVGKSALALNLALSMAKHGTKVCLFSFEMPSEEVALRLLARMSTIEISDLQSRDLTDIQTKIVRLVGDQLDSLPLEIYDSASMTVDTIRDAARNSLHGCDEGILIIDCLQLIQPSRDCECYEDNDAKLESVVIALKRLAMEFRVPIIVVDQLDQTDDIGDAYPLSEHADIVMFLDHANEVEGEGLKIWFSDKHWLPMDLYIAKFRQGPEGGRLKLRFAPRLMKFVG